MLTEVRHLSLKVTIIFRKDRPLLFDSGQGSNRLGRNSSKGSIQLRFRPASVCDN